MERYRYPDKSGRGGRADASRTGRVRGRSFDEPRRASSRTARASASSRGRGFAGGNRSSRPSGRAGAPRPARAGVGAAIDAAMSDVRQGKTGDFPRHLQNVHADSAGLEREQGYLYPHNFPNHWVRQQYLPDVIKDRTYYTYGDNKTEQAAKRYWEEIKK